MRSRTIHYGFDHRNRSGIALSRALWLSGYSNSAEELARQTVDFVAKLNHPPTHCTALIWSLAVHTWTEDLDAADTALEAFADCAESNALGPCIAAAAGFGGEIEIMCGRTEDALGTVEESLARLRSARYELLTTPFSIAIARGLLLEGRDREASDLIDGTIGRCDANGERFAMSELMRIKADILSRPGSDAAAIALLEQTIALARAQGALAWQFRAVFDLSLLLRASSRVMEASKLLRNILSSVPEGNETADVIRLRELATSLNTRAGIAG